MKGNPKNYDNTARVETINHFIKHKPLYRHENWETDGEALWAYKKIIAYYGKNKNLFISFAGSRAFIIRHSLNHLIEKHPDTKKIFRRFTLSDDGIKLIYRDGQSHKIGNFEVLNMSRMANIHTLAAIKITNADER